MFSRTVILLVPLLHLATPLPQLDHDPPSPALVAEIPPSSGPLIFRAWWTTFLWDRLAAYYLPLPDRIDNQECMKDVNQISIEKNLTTDGLWAAKMVDSWGKVPDGFFFGNVHTPGMYEECINVRAHYNYTHQEEEEEEEERSFRGQYCLIAYLPAEDEGGAEDTSGGGGAWRGGGESRIGLPIAVLVDPLPFYYATCIPSSCSQTDLEHSVNETLGKVGRQLWYVMCHPLDEEVPLRSGDYAMMSVLGVLGVTVVLATILDLATLATRSLKYRSGAYRYLLTFSLYRNLCLLFDPSPPSTPGTITCLAGIRVLTMCWIIVCHQYQSSLTFSFNTFDFTEYQDPILGQLFTNGWLSVDTFFFLGGLVLSLSLLPALTTSPLRATFIAYLKAVLRLSPIIALVAGFSATLLRLLASGPLQNQLVSWVDTTCRTLWWKDPLFVSNYILGENSGINVDDCLSHCWFTAVYMQLLLVLPLFLLPFLHSRRAGVAWLGVVSVASLVIPLVITLVYHLPPSQLATLGLDMVLEYEWRMLMAPWCRAGPWVVGVWTALAIYYTQHRTMDHTHTHTRTTTLHIPEWVVVGGYLAAAVVFLALLCGIYPYNHVPPSRQYTQAVAASYGALARPVWALCVAWVVLTCHTGKADGVNALLSYPAWWPLSRLCLGVFLVGPVVQRWWAKAQLIPVYFNYLSKLFESVGVLFVSGLVSIVLVCLIQLPITSIIHLLLSPRSK